MGRYNLLDEKWILVTMLETGQTEEVSLIDFFKNAHRFYDLAGDSNAQNFSLLRFLLAIVHTVYSRYDFNGELYEFLSGDGKNNNLEMDEDYSLKEINEELHETWKQLWSCGEFPSGSNSVINYLQTWRERFNLLDEKYPFYQVTKDDITSDKINKSKGTEVKGRFINRLISESNNKQAMFSPIAESKKDFLNFQQVVRWLITFQNYTGTFDKVSFGKEKENRKWSKGWLYDLGGIFFKGNNLFETLLLNCVLNTDDQIIQRPCWESQPAEIISRIMDYNIASKVDNLSELYTNWSRGIYINPDLKEDERFFCSIVKLNEIPHPDQFIEPMTIWKWNKGEQYYTPQKHTIDKKMWRSFGLIASFNQTEGKRIPGIVSWISLIRRKKLVGDFFDKYKLKIVAVGMKDDGNATSWLPVDEIYDELYIYQYLLEDIAELGWTSLINDVVEQTKDIIDIDYSKFLREVASLRNIKNNGFVELEKQKIFSLIDILFKNWIEGINLQDDKNVKVLEWRGLLRNLLLNHVNTICERATSRDYKGISKEGKNIITISNVFMKKCISYLKEGGRIT